MFLSQSGLWNSLTCVWPCVGPSPTRKPNNTVVSRTFCGLSPPTKQWTSKESHPPISTLPLLLRPSHRARWQVHLLQCYKVLVPLLTISLTPGCPLFLWSNCWHLSKTSSSWSTCTWNRPRREPFEMFTRLLNPKSCFVFISNWITSDPLPICFLSCSGKRRIAVYLWSSRKL